ncbi:hypothetical protein CRV24_010284 [Beauveria bassiana]|nr:hypothetical protein CRV24_010284 [Beauveria bassiana]KAH8713761.1 hypothetical protein HC256_006887 [Beauveria bassiana]
MCTFAAYQFVCRCPAGDNCTQLERGFTVRYGAKWHYRASQVISHSCKLQRSKNIMEADMNCPQVSVIGGGAAIPVEDEDVCAECKAQCPLPKESKSKSGLPFGNFGMRRTL